jgi:hypothetical protein
VIVGPIMILELSVPFNLIARAVERAHPGLANPAGERERTHACKVTMGRCTGRDLTKNSPPEGREMRS